MMHRLFLFVITVVGLFEVAVGSRFAKYLLEVPTNGSAETNVQTSMNVSAVLSSEVKSDVSIYINEPIQANVSIEDFWTPERIEEALRNPLPHPWERGSPNNRSKRHVAEGHSVPVLDSDYFRDMEIEFHEERIMHSYEEGAEVKLANTAEGPFNLYGALFMQAEDGRNYRCTAQVVGHPGILLTAAHCIVEDERLRFKSLVFYQKYKNGLGKVREIDRLFVPRQYEEHFKGQYGDIRYDFAYCTLKPGSWASDYLGYSFNGQLSGRQSAVAAGYPSNSYDGKRLVWIEANLRTSSIEQTLFMPANLMSGGCSGGAWLQRQEGDWKVVGLNSFSLRGKDGMYSPKFDEIIQSVFQNAKSALLRGGAEESGESGHGTDPPSRRRPCIKGYTYCGHERSGQGLDSNNLYHCDDADGTMTALASCSSGCVSSGTSYCEPSGSSTLTSSCAKGYTYCGHEMADDSLTSNYLYRCSSSGILVEIARCRNSCIYGGTSSCG